MVSDSKCSSTCQKPSCVFNPWQIFFEQIVWYKRNHDTFCMLKCIIFSLIIIIILVTKFYLFISYFCSCVLNFLLLFLLHMYYTFNQMYFIFKLHVRSWCCSLKINLKQAPKKLNVQPKSQIRIFFSHKYCIIYLVPHFVCLMKFIIFLVAHVGRHVLYS